MRESERRSYQRIKERRAVDKTYDQKLRDAQNLSSRLYKARKRAEAKQNPDLLAKIREDQKRARQQTQAKRKADSSYDQKCKIANRLHSKNYYTRKKAKRSTTTLEPDS